VKHWDILPPSLKIVAFLFIIGGGLVAAMSIRLLMREPPGFSTAGLLLAFIGTLAFVGTLTGVGLLWLNPWWKRFALALISVSLVVMPLAVLAMVMNYLSLASTFKHTSMGQLPDDVKTLLRKAYRHYTLLAPLMGGSWFVQFWAYRVLNKPTVRRLFGESDR